MARPRYNVRPKSGIHGVVIERYGFVPAGRRRPPGRRGVFTISWTSNGIVTFSTGSGRWLGARSARRRGHRAF